MSQPADCALAAGVSEAARQVLLGEGGTAPRAIGAAAQGLPPLPQTTPSACRLAVFRKSPDESPTARATPPQGPSTRDGRAGSIRTIALAEWQRSGSALDASLSHQTAAIRLIAPSRGCDPTSASHPDDAGKGFGVAFSWFVLDEFFQREFGVMKARLHRSDRRGGDARDFFERKIFEKVQQQNGALWQRKLMHESH